MRIALERAGLAPGDIRTVSANQWGLTIADDAESAAIARLFGDGVRVIAPKLRLGEPMGAGGVLNAALALEGWWRGNLEGSPHGPVLVNSLSLGAANSICPAPADDG